MRKKILMLMACGCLLAGSAHAQWVVTDPTNLAQSIINTTKEIVQTSKTVKNTLNNFKEVEKLYNESKKYYDALKKGEQPRAGRPTGKGDDFDGRRNLRHLCEELQEDAL